MKVCKRFVCLLLAISMMMVECVFANAMGNPYTKTKSTDYGTLKGEVWVYNDVTSTKEIGWEVAVQTSVASSYTMAESTVDVECQYNDTGKYPSKDWCAYNKAKNQNSVKAYLYFIAQPERDIVVHSTHEITYSKSFSLHMTTLLESFGVV